MQKASLGEVELEYELHGDGEPVLLIHPGIFSDWFEPLLHERGLTTRYRIVHYHRLGCAGSSRLARPVSFGEQAAHARALLQYLGIARAHVVGHSSSANIALQLALDAPDMVQSLALLEPALMSVPSAAVSRKFVGEAVGRYRAGDRVGAIDIFLRGTCGPEYRAVLDRALPAGFDKSVSDAATFFEQEMPALQQWSFRPEDARRVTQPALAIVGERSLQLDPIWGERHQVLLDGLPNVEPLVLPDTGHLLEVENPHGVADALTSFFARHSLTVPA